MVLQFAWVTDADLRLPVSVHFQNEAGRDEGGVTRDWYSVLSRQMFNEDYGLFTASASDDGTFQVNPNSGVNPDHLDFFRCARCSTGALARIKEGGSQRTDVRGCEETTRMVQGGVDTRPSRQRVGCETCWYTGRGRGPTKLADKTRITY